MPTARLGPSKSVPSSRIKINVTLKIKKNCTEFAELGLTKRRGVLLNFLGAPMILNRIVLQNIICLGCNCWGYSDQQILIRDSM
jgi:hypothetical protein